MFLPVITPRAAMTNHTAVDRPPRLKACCLLVAPSPGTWGSSGATPAAAAGPHSPSPQVPRQRLTSCVFSPLSLSSRFQHRTLRTRPALLILILTYHSGPPGGYQINMLSYTHALICSQDAFYISLHHVCFSASFMLRNISLARLKTP